MAWVCCLRCVILRCFVFLCLLLLCVCLMIGSAAELGSFFTLDVKCSMELYPCRIVCCFPPGVFTLFYS